MTERSTAEGSAQASFEAGMAAFHRADAAGAHAAFERAIALTGGRFLLHKVLFARVHAVATGDRALFEHLLAEVTRTPAPVMPEQRLANELAHRRAARYLKQIDDLF